jgi:hypothetical protein
MPVSTIGAQGLDSPLNFSQTTNQIILPRGTTAQRPVGAPAGSLRFNTSLNALETYNGTSWSGLGILDGLSEATAAPSALAILAQNPTAPNGLYWIRPGAPWTGSAVRVYCDMTFDGGGWIQAFVLHKTQGTTSASTNYFQTPAAATVTTNLQIQNVATPNDPSQSFCLPQSFWQAFGSDANGRGEVREEFAIRGGTWPNNTKRTVIFVGGRTAAGAAGNFLSSSIMGITQTLFGFTARGAVNYEYCGAVARGGYLSNTIGFPSRYAPSAGSNTVIGISVDASNLAFTNTDGVNTYTNIAAASSSAWVGRGNCCSTAGGSSQNGGDSDGTHWAQVFIR